MLVVLLVLALGGVVATGFVRASDTAVALFAESYSVPVTADNRALLDRYVTQSRRFRLLGVVAGLAYLIGYWITRRSGTEIIGPLALGYGVGAAGYELIRRPPSVGHASLEPRRLADYVAPPLVTGLWVVAIASAAVFGVGVLVGGSARSDFGVRVGSEELTRTGSIGLGVGGFVAVCLLATLARRIVGNPQPIVSPPIDAAQHAIRSAGLISVTGLGYWAAAVTGLAGVDLAARPDSPEWLRWLGWCVLPVTLLGSIGGFLLTVRSLPRFAPFWRTPPATEPAASRR